MSNSYYVTVTLPVWIADIPEGVTIEQVEKLLTESRWDEGRYPFDEELIQHGLRRVIHNAFREVLNSQLSEQYGNESVPDKDGKGETARWYLESQEIKGPLVHVQGSIKSAKIEQQCDKCRGYGCIQGYKDGFTEKTTCEACGGTGVEK